MSLIDRDPSEKIYRQTTPLGDQMFIKVKESVDELKSL